MLGGIFVADNAASSATEAVCQESPLPVHWLARSNNDGPGAAWNTAIRKALEDPEVTHVLVLDDDVVVAPETLSGLLEVIGGHGAAAPLLFDGQGSLWGFPEPTDPSLREAIRQMRAPEQCGAVFGEEAHPFCWATGACMLYTREAFEQAGYFREDFWMLGEDLELSMRVASMLGGVFTAQVAVPHLPPPPEDAKASGAAHRAKFLSLLQNLSYLSFHSPHRAHLRSYLGGNFKRYLQTEGLSAGALWDGMCAFSLGALRRQPAGTAAGIRLRERAKQRFGSG